MTTQLIPCVIWMDGSQVAAMDAVISIANTTVHGAGGLAHPHFASLANKQIGVGSILLFTRDIGIHQ